MNNEVYSMNYGWIDRRTGKEYEHTIQLTETELKKYHEILYYTSGVGCFDKEGNFIEDPFENMPYSYIVYTHTYRDCSQFFYEMACEYNMDFAASGAPQDIDEDAIGELVVFNEKPYSDGTFTYPGMYEFAGFIKEPEKYPF